MVNVVEGSVWIVPVELKTKDRVVVKVAVVPNDPPLKVRVPARVPKLFSALV
jgi:hypothetical protein